MEPHKVTAQYFAYCNEREAIRIRKEAGDEAPWTDDRILQQWSFCNVFREDDAHTRILASTLRKDDQPDLATWIVFARWLSRACLTECGKRFAGKPFDNVAARDLLDEFKPWSHGAYMLKSGYCRPSKAESSLGGMLVSHDPEPKKAWLIDLALQAKENFKRVRGGKFAHIREAFEWAAQLPQHGGLMAYETATDLEHTALVEQKKYPFAHCGPGAQRGWALLAHEHPDIDNAMDGVMHLMELANTTDLWTHNREWWPREAEHNLCEFFKYHRIVWGGRGKRKYDGKGLVLKPSGLF